jgi:hypothetical protein
MKIVEDPLSELLFPTKLNELVEDARSGAIIMVGLTETEGGWMLTAGNERGRFLPPRI